MFLQQFGITLFNNTFFKHQIVIPFMKLYKKIMSDSLYKNSIYLMVSTGIMAVLGFVFWMIASRMFSAVDIGLGTTIISAMGLVVGFSVLRKDDFIYLRDTLLTSKSQGIKSSPNCFIYD